MSAAGRRPIGRSPTGRSVRTDSTSAPARHRDVLAGCAVRVRCGTSHRTTERHGHGARKLPLGSTGRPAALTPHPGGARPGSPYPWPRTTLTHADRARQMLMRASSKTPSGKTLRACATTPASENHCTCHFPAVVDQPMASRPDPNGAGAPVGTRMGTPREDRNGDTPGRTFDFIRLRCNAGYGFLTARNGMEPPRASITKGK